MQHQAHIEAAPLMQGGSPREDKSELAVAFAHKSTPLTLLWFGASCSVVLGAFLGALACLSSFELVDSLQMWYLVLFGLILATLDTPVMGHVSIIPAMRGHIGRYIHLLTRMIGKSAVFMFLGCALFSAMWANVESVLLKVMAVLLGLFIVSVGLISGALALLKSTQLNKVRQHFQGDGEAVGHNALSQAYERHARLHSQLGMTPHEFNQMANETKGISFDGSDLYLVFNALASSPKRDAISLTDLHAWVKGSMVFL